MRQASTICWRESTPSRVAATSATSRSKPPSRNKAIRGSTSRAAAISSASGRAAPSTPFAAAATWTIADAGQCTLPPFPQGALTDPSQLYLTPRAQWQDTSRSKRTGERTGRRSPHRWDPAGRYDQQSRQRVGSGHKQWLWAYADGLLVNRAGARDGPSWLYSLEAGPTPNPKEGAGGAGTQASGAVNVNSGADPRWYLTLHRSGEGSARIGLAQGSTRWWPYSAIRWVGCIRVSARSVTRRCISNHGKGER